MHDTRMCRFNTFPIISFLTMCNIYCQLKVPRLHGYGCSRKQSNVHLINITKLWLRLSGFIFVAYHCLSFPLAPGRGILEASTSPEEIETTRCSDEHCCWHRREGGRYEYELILCIAVHTFSTNKYCLTGKF